jgi:RNA recognition motif-containing protein
MSKLLIGNIDTDASEEGIRQFFMPIMSQVVSVDIPVDPRTGKNRGYAYVMLRTDVQAENAVRELHGKPSLGRNMTITIVEQEPVKGKWYKFGAP